MANSKEIFKVLPDADVKILIEMLKKNLPSSYHVVSFAMNITHYKTQVPGIETGIYAPNGDYTDSTTFVYLKVGEMAMGTYYSETDAGCARIREALAVTNLFQSSSYILMSAVHQRVHDAVGTDWSHLQLDHITPCNLFSISCENALKLNPVCPDDVVIRKLEPEDALLVDSLWPHRMDGTVDLIRQVISVSSSVGLYRRSDNKLLSWVLKWFYGGLGILQTVDDAKRKGYAQIVVAELSKQLARENWPIHATVLVDNQASTPLFEKMGFTNEFVCHYIEYSQVISK